MLIITNNTINIKIRKIHCVQPVSNYVGVNLFVNVDFLFQHLWTTIITYYLLKDYFLVSLSTNDIKFSIRLFLLSHNFTIKYRSFYRHGQLNLKFKCTVN